MPNIPHPWRMTHQGAVNIFDPDLHESNVLSVRCDVTRGTGPWYRWGIKVKCDDGSEITLRGNGTGDCDESMAVCDAAYPLVISWAQMTPRPGESYASPPVAAPDPGPPANTPDPPLARKGQPTMKCAFRHTYLYCMLRACHDAGAEGVSLLEYGPTVALLTWDGFLVPADATGRSGETLWLLSMTGEMLLELMETASAEAADHFEAANEPPPPDPGPPANTAGRGPFYHPGEI